MIPPIFARRHPLAEEALEQTRVALVQLVGEAMAERRARERLPHPWALFHHRMATTLPRAARVRRRWHRARARRFAALAWAEDALSGTCDARCSTLAAVLGIERPH